MCVVIFFMNVGVSGWNSQTLLGTDDFGFNLYILITKIELLLILFDLKSKYHLKSV